MADGDQKIEIELALRDAMSSALQSVGREMAKLNRQAQESSQSGSGLGNLGAMFGAMSKNLIGPLGIVAGISAAAKGMAEFATSRIQFEYFARDLRVTTQAAGTMSTALDRLGVDGKKAFGNLAGAMKEIDIKKWNSDFLQAIAAMPEGGQEFANKLFNAKTVQERIDIFLDYLKNKAGPNAQAYLADLIHVPEHALLGLDEQMKTIRKSFEVTPEMRQYKKDWDQFWDDYAATVETAGQKIFRAYGAIREGYKKLGEVTLENPALLPEGRSALGYLLTPELLGGLTPESQLFGGKKPKKPSGSWIPKGSMLERLFKRQSYEEGEGAGETTEFSAKSMSFSSRLQTMKAFERGGILGALQQRGYELPPWLQKAYGFLNNPDMVMAMGSLNPLASPGAIPMKALMAEMPVSAATGLLDWRRRSGLGGGGEIKDLIDTESDSNKLLRDIRDTLDRIAIGGGGGLSNYGSGQYGGTNAPGGGGAGGSVGMGGVSEKLLEGVRAGAELGLPEGYTYKFISGFRPGDPRYHGRGQAADIQIYDEKGNAIPNVGNHPQRWVYDKVALATKAYFARKYPGYNYIYGGHFNTGVPNDLMHHQEGGTSARRFSPEEEQAEIERQNQIDAEGRVRRQVERTVSSGSLAEPDAPAVAGSRIGVRANNPMNIMYTGTGWQKNFPGLTRSPFLDRFFSGKSQAIAQFNSPQAGWNAAAQLVLSKYRNLGYDTVERMIAAKSGWTPGYSNAVHAVAGMMGVGPRDKVDFSDPTMMSKFLRALEIQELGKTYYPSTMADIAASKVLGAGDRPATFNERFDAFTNVVDRQMTKGSGSVWEGSANIEVDFKNVPRGVRTSADQEGFKTLKIKRDRQGEISDRNTADNTWAYE